MVTADGFLDAGQLSVPHAPSFAGIQKKSAHFRTVRCSNGSTFGRLVSAGGHWGHSGNPALLHPKL